VGYLSKAQRHNIQQIFSGLIRQYFFVRELMVIDWVSSDSDEKRRRMEFERVSLIQINILYGLFL
jgi:hypothetical protein